MQMTFSRLVLPELLDGLEAQDPVAQRSRRDLQRVHRVMGTRNILLRALRALPIRQSQTPLRILELGAGDGSLMLGVARALQGEWPEVKLTLLDRQHLLNASTIAEYARIGWTATAQVGDVFDWAFGQHTAAPPAHAPPHWDLIVVNLFLHHFQTPQLSTLLAVIAARTEHFVACEPRRAWLAWAGSHLIGLLGVNAVTREDAVLSVRAGFCGTELETLWPTMAAGRSLAEYPAGLFSHCFVATNNPGKPTGTSIEAA